MQVHYEVALHRASRFYTHKALALNILLTLLLTGIAFKLVINDTIPKVSYYTMMDYYMNGMLLLLFIIAVENARRLRRDTRARSLSHGGRDVGA